ncbi:hypothetical protein M405DRAFT_847347 [Rhizopogon salebrosus TDB-379]|nr:hypothetical protein M405DRAFT_847347 [Rhizopogon salebrosus TDB-379]
MSSSTSSLSSFSSRLDTVCRRACDETALNSSTFALPIDSWFADREDELALSLVNIFHSAESAVADVTHLHADPRNSPHTFAIVRQLNKIKGLSLDSLQARGLHDAVKEITSSFEKFRGYPPPTLSEVEQINSGEPPSEAPSPKMENTSPIPIPPPTAEQYTTPSPDSSFLGLDHAALSPASTDSDLPTWCRTQVTVRSTGRDRASRKKHRKSVSYALGLPHCHALLNERMPTPFPSSSAPATFTTPIIEDAEAVISTGIEIPQDARPSERASSEERFRDRNGMGDYSHFICRYCSQEGHRQVDCPCYFCRVCTWHTPGHLSAFCPQLNGHRLFKAKPRTWDFYSKLKQWEDAKDAEFEDHEASFYEDLNYDHNLYDNTDN